MLLSYLVEIKKPQTHIVNVTVTGKRENRDKLTVFLPSWSPGSYLMREYGKNIRVFKALSANGEYLNFEQITKGQWLIDFENSDLKSACTDFSIEYEVFCHELTVRTSHVDESHAYLHGPSYLVGIKDEEISGQIEFKFPPLWSKIHLGLEEVDTGDRNRFVYKINDYDELLDCPAEIGCHDSDGFTVKGLPHHIIFYGKQFPHDNDIKADIKKIVETVSEHFSSIPYDSYLFMTHLKRNLYGGLEHKNSTALQFDGRKFANRTDYINWLALVAHEYFHTWNVKRIRPIELGPFDYLAENYTKMHWLTEGLTSFMDELFVIRARLCSIDEYLAMQIKNLNRYFAIPGKKFHSLEQSSFNAWIKLYRPDENSNNSSISYYLKGGLVFSTLHFEFRKAGKSINDLLTLLWDRYLENPAVGVTTAEVLSMIEKIGNKEIRDQFEQRISTTEDIDFESYYLEAGMKFEWSEQNLPHLGCTYDFEGDRAVVKEVVLDGPGFKAGLNAGDELIAVNGTRVLKTDVMVFNEFLVIDRNYTFTVSRLGDLMNLEILIGKSPRILKTINVVDEAKAIDFLLN
jgi:predicted metalloprotease with PDZ domain